MNCSATVAIALLICAVTPGQSIQLAEVPPPLPPDTYSGQASQTGDVNGDGLLDLLFVGSSNGAIWLATPVGGFVSRTVSFTPAPSPGIKPVFALADFEGDGDLDVVVLDTTMEFHTSYGSSLYGGAVRLYMNQGYGTFVLSQIFGSPLLAGAGEVTRSIATGDVDGDGDIDIMVAVAPFIYAYRGSIWTPSQWAAVGGQDHLFLNAGNGTFVDTPGRIGDPGLTSAVRLEDFDGDGDLDAYFANSDFAPIQGLGQDRLYRNNGIGWFTPAPPLTPDLLRNGGAVARDFDADGDVDVLLHDVPNARLLVNAGNGTFTPATPLLANLANDAEEIMAGDWNGDSRIDYAFRSPTSWTPVYNQGGLLFTSSGPDVIDLSQVGYRPKCLADFERDGDLDLIAAGTGGSWSQTRMWRNNGSSPWQPLVFDAPGVDSWSRCVAAGDLDGDGDGDFLVGGDGPTPGLYFRNDGSGRFQRVANGQFTTDTGSLSGIALANLDGDLDLDVVVTRSGGPGQVYWNTGPGLMAGPSLPSSGLGVSIGDLDGDSDGDLYLSGLNGDGVVLNQGGGVLGTCGTCLPAGIQSNENALADLDGDGDLDVVAVNSTATFTLRNNGNGSFVAWPFLGTSAPAAAFAVGDFDGDLDQDVVIGATLWRNDGTGSFVGAPSGLPGATGTVTNERMLARDLDGDGDLDILRSRRLVGSAVEPATVFANDGTGLFTPVANALPDDPWFVAGFAAGDLDGDDDIDVVAACPVSPRVLWNRHHHLSAAFLPRIGHTLDLVLQGRANEPVALALALAPWWLPVPGLGILRLHPGSLLLVSVGTYDASGLASYQIAVPAIPSLLGLSAYWQALSGTVPRLGNLETTTFR